MLAVSMLNTLFRPDPTAAVCVLGIYAGAHPGGGAWPIIAFAAATMVTVMTDFAWWYTDDTVLARSLGSVDEFNHLPRAVQLPVCLTALNMMYKSVAIAFSISLATCCRTAPLPGPALSPPRRQGASQTGDPP